jgi:hypothetical protein
MTDRTSKMNQRTTSWIMSNANELAKLPKPDESPWSTEERDLTNADINLWKAKGVIKRANRNDDGVRCEWTTPEDVWSEFERSVNKYGYDNSLVERDSDEGGDEL